MYRVFVPLWYELFVDAPSEQEACKVADAMMDATDVFWEDGRGIQLVQAREVAGMDPDVFRFRDAVTHLVDDATVYYRVGCSDYRVDSVPDKSAHSVMLQDFPDLDSSE